MSEANDPAPVSAHVDIEVLRGNPTAEELAAVVAVLGGVSGGGTPEQGPRERNLWGIPADKLRYPIFSWQRLTLLQRTYIRR